MAEEELVKSVRWNERLAAFAHYLLASLMLACALISVVQMGHYLQPDWSGAYLVLAGFLVSLESMYSQRLLRDALLFSKEWILYRATEWVVILICLKLVLYAVRGFDLLWAELPLWRENFVDYFFTPEYFFAAIVLFLVWALAGLIGSDLLKLEGDEKLLSFEREGGRVEQRADVRRGLANTILAIGGLMIFLAALVRLDWEALWGSRPPLDASVWNILAYFLLALILLSLTQFSVLRVRWSLDRVPLNRDIAWRWLRYSALFLLAVTIAAGLLPTRYSVGLLDVLGFLVSFLIFILSLLSFLLVAPLALLLSLLSRLLGRTEDIAPPKVQPLAPLIQSGAEKSSWAELLKSLLFWSVFVAVISLSIIQYLKQNRQLMEALHRMPLIGALMRYLQRVWNWLKGASHDLAAGVGASLGRLRARPRQTKPRLLGSYLNLRRLSPRQRVIFYYLALVRRGGEQGLERIPSQTPYEYSQKVGTHLPEVEPDISTMTERFVEARYSRHQVTEGQAGLVQRSWQRIRRALRSILD